VIAGDIDQPAPILANRADLYFCGLPRFAPAVISLTFYTNKIYIHLPANKEPA